MKSKCGKVSFFRCLICSLLCLTLVFGALALTSCNSEKDSDKATDDGKKSEDTATDKNVEEGTKSPDSTDQDLTPEIDDRLKLDENGMVDVLVFTEDAPRGTKVTLRNAETVKMSPINLPGNIVSDLQEVRGQYTNKDFYAGDPVIKSRLSRSKPLENNNDVINQEIARSDSDYLVVTDYIKVDTGEDIYDNLQMLINKNPGRTLYFPDGEYLISRPLETSSKASESTSFHFSNGAVLRAHEKWQNDGMKRALICLGALKNHNDIRTPGSNFFVMGGILDGGGRADGISIDAGRETLIKGVTIVDVHYGIHIKTGTNNNSSDSDIDDVTIIGNGTGSSCGVITVGLDNTITNVRVYNCQRGFQLSSGCFVSNCTVENTAKIDGAIGFYCSSTGDAWYSNCTSIDCDIAFNIGSTRGFYKNCNAYWPSNMGNQHIAFKTDRLNSPLIGCTAIFPEGEINSAFMTASEGSAKIVSPMFDKSLVSAEDRTVSFLENGTSIITPHFVGPENEEEG